ncbi:hypothetical protein TSTA_072100 [Talaromyces stipitatus ATCC 10500]|uniref:Uncharacterized protein n=1 Tax=Talaromyces stipitatus (strain ATCC 10500 / CBS 375.48 / QM 6759 / NRRL 1006) TaxID=441959 RepID=B8LTY8_TALSN|nr:uncharacterized protein TSTA_072100 [Talaromyces stipitatus ATCC 10500]EED23818.1 hypothetical protein TSTA_072100 [Talaromyces stipitatus ATCC 10500]
MTASVRVKSQIATQRMKELHTQCTVMVVHDLHQLISQLIAEKMGISDNNVTLVLVASSIGCALARLYAQKDPGTAAGLLFLDSVLANSDCVSIFPDPDTEGFDPAVLPAGITHEMLCQSREATHDAPSILSDGPIMQGPENEHGPYVRITQLERSMGPLLAPTSGHFLQRIILRLWPQELNEILSQVL